MPMKFLLSILLSLPGALMAQQKTAGINQTSIPPFVRQGDQPLVGFQLFNNSKKDWTGTIHFQLVDTLQDQPVDGWFFNQQGNQYFTIEPAKKEWIEFPIHIPFEFNKPTAWELRIKTDTSTLFTTGNLQLEPWKYAAEATTAASDPEGPIVVKKTKRLITKDGRTREELLTDNATVRIGDTLLVEIEMTKSKSRKIILIEQWPAGTQPNMVRTLSTHTGASKVLQLSQEELQLEWLSATDMPLKISYQLIARYTGWFQIPPAVVSGDELPTPFIRSSYSSLHIEQRKLP